MLNDRIQAWLIKEGKSRSEFAKMLHISPRTVDGWLGKVQRPIPHKMHEAIELIIAPPSEPGCIAQEVAFTAEEWELLTKGLPDGADKQEAVKQYIMGIIKAARLPGEQ
jgi:transcriptional regulator with XRE-family HTH domain